MSHNSFDPFRLILLQTLTCSGLPRNAFESIAFYVSTWCRDDSKLAIHNENLAPLGSKLRDNADQKGCKSIGGSQRGFLVIPEVLDA